MPRKPPTKTRQQRGYGRRHEKQRQKLLHNLKDGTPCPHCGKPLYKDPTKNFDRAPLEANHTNPLANHTNKQTAPLADELLHRHCNRSLGDYTRKQKPKKPTFNWQSTTRQP